MKKFSELPLIAQLGIFLVLPAIIIGVSEFLYFPLAEGGASTLQDMQAANVAAKEKLDKLIKENNANAKVEKDLRDMIAETQVRQAKLEQLKSIVPVEKDLDGFIKMVKDAAESSGVGVRRFTPLGPATREFYVELPIEIEFDGNFATMVQFFSKIGGLSRIANVTNLAVGPLSGTARGVRRKYSYTPSETIVAGCTVTTFFRRPDQGKPGPAPAKK